MEPSIIDHIDQTTLTSLLAVVVILLSAYALSLHALSPNTPSSIRILFIWHAFDFLIHTIFEGSFLYNCFFTYVPRDANAHNPSTTTNFLNRADRLYGAAYGE